jgi:hypothetical protein
VALPDSLYLHGFPDLSVSSVLLGLCREVVLIMQRQERLLRPRFGHPVSVRQAHSLMKTTLACGVVGGKL